MIVYGIIPARLESTRLPRKLLLCETGKPLLQHTWESASAAESLTDLIIATDSAEIAAAAQSFGARCEMTGAHASGTDRIAEVAGRCLPDADIVVNIQGDEPQIDPAQIDLLVKTLTLSSNAEMATLAAPIRDEPTLLNPACVKVVCGQNGRALYFSRSPIPFNRDEDVGQLMQGDSPWLLHIGVYAYRAKFLQVISQASMSKLERLERLEQLRALEFGAEIRIAVVDAHAPGIDTPEDYARFEQSTRKDRAASQMAKHTPRVA